jgi:hypothetical protein
MGIIHTLHQTWRHVVENSTCKNTTGSADQTVRRFEFLYLFCVCAYDLHMAHGHEPREYSDTLNSLIDIDFHPQQWQTGNWVQAATVLLLPKSERSICPEDYSGCWRDVVQLY